MKEIYTLYTVKKLVEMKIPTEEVENVFIKAEGGNSI